MSNVKILTDHLTQAEQRRAVKWEEATAALEDEGTYDIPEPVK